MKTIKEIAKKYIPVTLRNYLWRINNNISKKSNIRKWKEKGCPNPPPHQYKQCTIAEAKEESGCNVFVETGTYKGDMVEAQRKRFKKIYSVELNKEFWKAAIKRFKKYKHINLLQGDSGLMLNKVTEELKEQAVFWLDGHYSSGDTARGEKDCPIYGEIDAILKNNNYNHILIIDDADSFNGAKDYPTINKLREYINNYNSEYNFNLKNGLIIFSPKSIK